MNIPILIPLIVAVVMAAAFTIALGYPYLQAKLSVLCAGGFVFVLALVQLVKELRLKKTPAHDPAADRTEPRRDASFRQYALETAWMVGFGIAIYIFGFIIAIPCFIAAYMKSHGTGWAASIITGVLMAACYYGLFTLFFEMDLYLGILFA